MWCWHHIKENLNNLCPACRNPYHDNPHAFSAVEKEEIMRNKREMKPVSYTHLTLPTKA